MGNSLSNINGNIWINNHYAITQDGIVYNLNYKEKTAKIISIDMLFDFDPMKEEITIPRSIQFDSEEYIITSIASKSFQDSDGSDLILPITFPADSEIRTFENKSLSKSSFNKVLIPPHITTLHEKTFYICENLQTVEFMENCELQVIEKNAFKDSRIEKLIIPSTVLELQDGWCSGLYRLTNVQIMPKNKKYLYLNETYIIEKTDINNDNYDILTFARRNLTYAQIPSFITKIKSAAFAETLIESIVIPPSVTEIGERVFDFCERLEKVEFTLDSNIKSIGKKTFYDSSVNTIIIPSSIIDLKGGWCAGANLKTMKVFQNKQLNTLMINDQIIVQKSNLSSDDYDVLVYAQLNNEKIILPSFIKNIQPYVFYKSLITTIFIPSKVTEIGRNAFQNCLSLQDIQFASDSQLQIIGKKAFSGLHIKTISIPSSVTKICESAFADCSQLKNIIIPNSSKLQIIEFGAFMGAKINTINIPSNILELKNGWNSRLFQLNEVKIIPNEQKNILFYDNKFLVGKSDLSSNEYDVLLFVKRKNNEKKVIIPSFIKIISSFSFERDLIVESVVIPSQVTQIKQYAFHSCNNLTHIEISNDSNLSIIEKDLLFSLPVSCLYIPQHVKEIGLTMYLDKLLIVEFADNVKINDDIDINDLISIKTFLIMIPAISPNN